MFKIGDRVKHSGYATRGLHDAWCNAGDYTRKANYRAALDKMYAERGTVTAIIAAVPSRHVASGVEVTWDHGSISRGFEIRVEKV